MKYLSFVRLKPFLFKSHYRTLMDQALKTTRLSIREFTRDDAGFILELLNSPGWLTFVGDRQIRTLEQAEDYIVNICIKSYQEQGFGFYIVELIDSYKAIGMCGFIKRDYLPYPDIGFALLSEYEGQGYAYEMASAILQYGREQLKLLIVMAITLPHNERSIRLLQRLNLQFERRITRPPENEELLLFSI